MSTIPSWQEIELEITVDYTPLSEPIIEPECAASLMAGTGEASFTADAAACALVAETGECMVRAK